MLDFPLLILKGEMLQGKKHELNSVQDIKDMTVNYDPALI